MTIQDVQNDGLPAGSPVSLKGVVVAAIDIYGARTGDLYLAEPEGGAFSGVKVFNVPVEQVGLLAVGDIVDLTGGEKDEFALAADTSGRTTTEIKPITGGAISVVKTGTGAVPTPTVVDGLAFSTLDVAAQDVEWEKWEGVLITVTNARQVTPIGDFAPSGSTPADDQFSFDLTGGLVVESVLGPIPTTALAQTCYGHFYIEHNRGHHVRVATPEDPASSRVGENFYQFLPRTVWGSLVHSWRLEE
ncbi:MAG: hypothetical protein NT062_18930, partial [Proteobacteria bacterium]|nr:hypothetical protein [Pseudomonadota bacterium]